MAPQPPDIRAPDTRLGSLWSDLTSGEDLRNSDDHGVPRAHVILGRVADHLADTDHGPKLCFALYLVATGGIAVRSLHNSSNSSKDL